MLSAMIVCVEFDDYLAITLPHALAHVDRILVVTSPQDHRTQALCAKYAKVETFCTDAFWRNGAEFNKGLAMEEGFDALGRSGRILILDADIVLPPNINLQQPLDGKLLGVHRRQCPDAMQWDGSFDWSGYDILPDGDIAGYFQLFDADSPYLQTRPWYPTQYRSAATCDQVFTWKFRGHCEYLPDYVLHLGPLSNWTGRRFDRLDGTVVAEKAERQASLDRIVQGRRNGNNHAELLP